MSGCILPLPLLCFIGYCHWDCVQTVLRRLSQAWRSMWRGWCVRDRGREGDMVVTSIIHNSIARETGCEGIGESDQYE